MKATAAPPTTAHRRELVAPRQPPVIYVPPREYHKDEGRGPARAGDSVAGWPGSEPDNDGGDPLSELSLHTTYHGQASLPLQQLSLASRQPPSPSAVAAFSSASSYGPVPVLQLLGATGDRTAPDTASVARALVSGVSSEADLIALLDKLEAAGRVQEELHARALGKQARQPGDASVPTPLPPLDSRMVDLLFAAFTAGAAASAPAHREVAPPARANAIRPSAAHAGSALELSAQIRDLVSSTAASIAGDLPPHLLAELEAAVGDVTAALADVVAAY